MEINAVGNWLKFSESKPDREGDYIVCKDNEFRKAWWDGSHLCFMIHPESEFEADNDFPYYEDYIPDYWAAVRLPEAATMIGPWNG